MKTCKTCRKWYPISDTMGMCYAPGEFMKLAHESCGRWEHETAGAQKEDAAEGQIYGVTTPGAKASEG